MWALAIWDSRRRELTLSRDRFGVKPLHLRRHGNALFFASEIKGLLAGTSARARANAQTVHDFLVHGAANCDNDTFFDGITAFPPGCVATLKPDRDLTVEPEPYWRLDPTATREIPFARACDEFRDLLTSSVRIRMRSDVPVGACLSGGLDSSSIVCLMDRDASGSAIHTFTARFPEPEFDESAWARCVIEATGVTGHFSMPTESGLLEDLDELIWHQEEPFSTASLYAQWLVMKQAREHDIPVLLDGQGADEILAGYRKFYAFHILALVRAHRIASAMGEFAALLRHGDRGYLRWREGARYLPAFMQRHVVSGRDFVTPELAHTTRTGHVALGASGDLRMRQMLDLTRYSVPSLLRYEDRNSMAGPSRVACRFSITGWSNSRCRCRSSTSCAAGAPRPCCARDFAASFQTAYWNAVTRWDSSRRNRDGWKPTSADKSSAPAPTRQPCCGAGSVSMPC